MRLLNQMGIGGIFDKGGGINVGGSIEDTIKNTAKDAIKKAAKEALAKALNVDIDKIDFVFEGKDGQLDRALEYIRSGK